MQSNLTDDRCFLLHEIAANNDVELLKKLLSFFQTQGIKVDLNQKNEKGQTPLHIAAIYNKGSSHFKVVEILLNNGADPNAKDKYGYTPVYELVDLSADVEILKLFLRFKADFINTNEDELSLLNSAIKYSYDKRNLDVLKFLVEDIGWDVNHRDTFKKTPLHQAAENDYDNSNGCYEIFEYLLENGADPNAKDNNGATPVYYLIQNIFNRCNLEILKLFFKFKADFVNTNYHKLSLLIIAVDNLDGDNLDVLKFLVQDVGLNVNCKDYSGMTPLHKAARCNQNDSHFQVLEFLLENKADPNAKDKYDKTPLWYLIEKTCDLEILKSLKLFLRFKADFTLKDKKELSFLAAAADNGDNLELLKFLVQDIGLDFNDSDKDGLSPLHHAASHNKNDSHYEIFVFLLENGSDPNAEDRYGKTPLWDLIQNCNLETLKLFLKFKADYTWIDKEGSTLLAPATNNFHNLDVVKFLVEDLGLDLNQRNKNGTTPLQHAVRYNKNDSHYEVLEYLLVMGADLNPPSDSPDSSDSSDDSTPLSDLIKNCNLEVLKLFLKFNADFTIKTKRGSSLLVAATNNRYNLDVLRFLVQDIGLDVNNRGAYEMTPLHCAADYNRIDNHCEVLKCLLEMGADLNAQDIDGSTPLHHLVRHANKFVVKILLKKGANVNAPDNYGILPISLAMHRILTEKKEQFFKNLDFLNLLIDQTDFSVVHVGGNLVGNRILRFEVLPDYRWKWILEHLAKLKFLNISIDSILQEFIENHSDYRDYFEKCTKELEAMKNSKLQNSWVTFFNLLVDGRRKLKNYVGNRNLIQDYESNDWLTMFPIYGASIKKNFENGVKRRELFDKSVVLLSDCLPIFDTDDIHLIVRDTLDCILSKKDLSKLCE